MFRYLQRLSPPCTCLSQTSCSPLPAPRFPQPNLSGCCSHRCPCSLRKFPVINVPSFPVNFFERGFGNPCLQIMPSLTSPVSPCRPCILVPYGCSCGMTPHRLTCCLRARDKSPLCLGGQGTF